MKWLKRRREPSAQIANLENRKIEDLEKRVSRVESQVRALQAVARLERAKAC